VTVCFLLGTACGSNSASDAGAAGNHSGGSAGSSTTGGGGESTSSGGKPATGDSGKGGTASGGKPATGDAGKGGTASGGTASGGRPETGEGGVLPNGGADGARPPAMGTPGVWEEVTSDKMDPKLFSDGNFGIGNVVADPARPTDVYAGGYGSIWKSTDYGLTWTELDSNPKPPGLALGHVLAVAGTTPPTLWMANINGAQHVYRSRDGGATFTLTGEIPEQPDAQSLYSIEVDPYNANHLLTGLHEQDKVLESRDGGDTFRFVSGSGFPSGGRSWFPYFVNTGDGATTAKTWFAIAQDGGSAVMTTDSGDTWVQPKGLEGLQHPHGSSGFFQRGQTLFVAGMNGPEGIGVYRSTDLGKNWKRVADGSGAVVWGSDTNLYAMWGWACGGCTDGAQYQTSTGAGDTWVKGDVPAALNWGPNSVATTSDGTHHIYIGSMWATGLWRYIEP
jgi:hypothetical protein